MRSETYLTRMGAFAPPPSSLSPGNVSWMDPNAEVLPGDGLHQGETFLSPPLVPRLAGEVLAANSQCSKKEKMKSRKEI